MYSWNDPDDRVAIVQMNADLRHAQLDLLSAQCATDRLRLRFSVEDLARFGEKDVLRKTIGTAVALSEYYLSIQNEMPADSTSFDCLGGASCGQAGRWLSLEPARTLLWQRHSSEQPVRKKACGHFSPPHFSTGCGRSSCTGGAFPLPRSTWRPARSGSTTCPS